jgi:hypothetical protein
MIIEGLKKRFYDEKSKKGGKWIDELPHVIWGLRTQPSKATGQTPFFLSTALKQFYRLTSCGNPQGLKCTMKARRMKQGS